MSVPPTFLQPLPAETDATDGDIVTFQVRVSDDPSDPTSVSWWRCGEPLRPLAGRREVLRHAGGWHELILSNVSWEDEGEYECRAENGRGHESCFGSLYYHYAGGGGRRGRTGTLTDVTMEGTYQESDDGRRSGLLILIDDGSQSGESSEKSNRKSMTVSEQMQGIIEDLTTRSEDNNRTGSERTLEEEHQFDSDIEEMILEEMILGARTASSEDTLVPSPDHCPPLSEGAGVSYGLQERTMRQEQRWSSDPDRVKKEESTEAGPWPPEDAMDPLPDSATTSTELPFAFRNITGAEEEEERECPGSGHAPLAGAETPFDVADITEETVDGDGAAVDDPPPPCIPREDGDDPPASPRADDSFTSVTELLGYEACHRRSAYRMSSFVRSSVRRRHAEEETTTSSSLESSSSFRQQTRRTDELEEDGDESGPAKRSRREAEERKSPDRAPAVDTGKRRTFHRKGFDVYLAIMDFVPMETDEEAVAVRAGQRVEVVDASRPRRWFVRVAPEDGDGDSTPREGWVPACYLERRRSTICEAGGDLGFYGASGVNEEIDPREMEAMQNREAVVRELVETEEDFARDMQFVVEHYYRRMEEDPRLPKRVRDRKGSVFGNFKDIADFHNNVLMEGIHYHAKEPTKLGKTFLRLERDFDMHVNYCWNEARAQRLLKEEGPLKDYFDEQSRAVEDDKLLSDHLKLPIQRLNDYQLLLKELIKYSSRLNEDTSDLQKALDFIHGLNGRTRDLQCVMAIEGCRGDVLKCGRTLRHEVLDLVEDGGRTSERHVFLFRGRLFVTEQRSSASAKETYHVTNLFKLQDVELVDSVEGDDPLVIEFRSLKRGTRSGFPLTLRARSAEQKAEWLRDIAAAASQAVEDLGDLEPSVEAEPAIAKHKAEEEEDLKEAKRPKVEQRKEEDIEYPKEEDDKPIQSPKEKEDEPDRKKPREDKNRGEDNNSHTTAHPHPRLMSDSGCSDARLESVELNEDNATLASEMSLRSDESCSPGENSSPPSSSYSHSYSFHCRHLLMIVVPVLCAFYVATQFLGAEFFG